MSIHSGRLSALDSLRGLAAIGVVIHHVVLVQAPEARDLYASTSPGAVDPLVWLLTYTPLHLPWLGTVNVLVFFALSGLALATPLLRGTVGNPFRYWLARAARLYLPAWASLLLGTLIIWVGAATVSSEGSQTYTEKADQLSAFTVLRDAALIPGHVSNVVNGVLWSLGWEVLFSFLVPLVVLWLRWAGSRSGAMLITGVPVAVLLIASTAIEQPLLQQATAYGALFLGGATLALARQHNSAVIAPRASGATGLVVLTAAIVVGLSARWLLLPTSPSPHAVQIADMVTCVAALATVWLVIVSPLAQRLLGGRFWRLAGTLSFSLYLTHAAVLELSNALAGGALWGTLIGVVLCVPVAVLFHRFVEAPSQALSRTIRRGAQGSIRAVPVRVQ